MREITLTFTVCAGILLLTFLSCGLLDPHDDTTATPGGKEIEIDVDRNGTATPSSSYILTGTVSAEDDLDSIVVIVRDPDGNRHAEEVVTFNGPTTEYDLENNEIELDVSGSDCNGTYRMTVRVYSAGESESEVISVAVSGAQECKTVTPVLTLGDLSVSGSSTVTPGSPLTMTGTFSCRDCEDTLVFEVTVKNSLGMEVTDNTVSADITVDNDEYTLTIEAAGTACNDLYGVFVSAETETLSDSAARPFTVSDAVDCNALDVSDILILGAQDAQEGSSLDIDAFNVHTISSAKENDSVVDLIVGYSDVDNAIMFGSPVWARNAAMAVVKGWHAFNTNRFKEIPLNISFKTATWVELQTVYAHVEHSDEVISPEIGKQYITLTSKGALAVIEIIALSDTPDGTISVRIARTEEDIMQGPSPLVFEEGGNVEISFTQTLGADANVTYGSSINLDDPYVMLSLVAREHAESVDLVYVHSFATDEDVLATPAWAHESDFEFVTDWSMYNTTKFYKLDGTDFDDISTRDEIEALWQETLAIDPSVPVAVGDVLIARTDQDNLVLIKIFGQVSGDAGTIDIKVAR